MIVGVIYLIIECTILGLMVEHWFFIKSNKHKRIWSQKLQIFLYILLCKTQTFYFVER